jgi:uncharacterized membrane protein YcaP (DUF421 family)
MFFNSWEDLARVLIMGTCSYIALIALLRVSGKRTLSKMNMFDFVVTIALGSTFATVILSKEVALAEGILALGLLILLQFIVASLSVRSHRFQELVKGEPTLLFFRGDYLHDTIKNERIAPEEIRSAARAEGIHDMATVGAVVLETDGTFSVIPDLDTQNNSALKDIQYPSSDHGDATDVSASEGPTKRSR